MHSFSSGFHCLLFDIFYHLLVLFIGNEAFSNCENLISFRIPAGVEMISMASFGGCSSLKELVIPTTVTSIGSSAFSSCSSLETVILPTSIRSIGIEAFGTTIMFLRMILIEINPLSTVL